MGIFSRRRLDRKPELDFRQQLISDTQAVVQRDREYLTSVLVEVTRKHWDALEDKFETAVEEDDYGNVVVDTQFKNDIYYFSERVVIPELQSRVNSNLTTNKNLTLIFANTVSLFRSIPKDLFGVKFKDSDTAIARKVTTRIDDSNLLPFLMTDEFLNNRNAVTDEALRAICSDPSFIANHSSMRVAPTLNLDTTPDAISDALMQQSEITLRLDGVKFIKPITVSSFNGLIMVLFLAMYSSKKQEQPVNNHHISEDFIGNDPYKYEEFIKKLLQARGFGVKRTRSSGDYGVDVIASKDGRSFALQCKLYNRPVGTKAVQEIVSGRIFYKTDYAIVVSDNSFTPAAKTLARKSDVILVHHKKLLHTIESLTGGNEGEK